MRARLSILSTGLLSIALSGCWPQKKKPPMVMVPPAPAPAAAPKREAPMPGAPVITAPTLPEMKLPQEKLPEESPLSNTPKKKAPEKKSGAVPAAAVETPPIPVPPPPPPALGEILTDARRRELENSLSEDVARARAALARTSGRRLTASQRESVNRIRTFIQQAEQAKTHDLSTALQLARRAALLGDDLARSMQ